jgi:hypothetical protein
MRKLVGVGVLFLLGSLPMVAQDTPPRVEVFSGYSYAFIDVGFPFNHENFGAGWHGAFQGNFNDWLAIVADVSGHYKGLPNVSPGLADIKVKKHFYTFGPRITARSEKVNFFFHGLFGGARSNFDVPGTGSFDDNAFTMIYGGGVDWNPSQRVAIRIFQIDGVFPKFSGTFDSNFRLSTGLVIRFGGGS